jgi:hypothetical protein
MGTVDQVQVGQTVTLRSDDGQYFAAFEVVEPDQNNGGSCPVDSCTVMPINDDGDESVDRHVGLRAIEDAAVELTNMGCSGRPTFGYWKLIPPSPDEIAAVGKFLEDAWNGAVNWAKETIASAADAVGLLDDYYETQIAFFNSIYSAEHYAQGQFSWMSLEDLIAVEDSLGDFESEITSDIFLTQEEKVELQAKLVDAEQIVLLARLDAEASQTGMAGEQ